MSPESVAEAYHNYQHGLQPNMSPLSAAQVSNQTIQDSMKLYNLGRAFQVFGHFSAKIDPLGLERRSENAELELGFYNFSEQDLDRQFYIGTWKTTTGFLAENKPVRTLREYHDALKHTYTENIGYEYMHIPNRQMCNWIRDKIEVYSPEQFTPDEKIKILDRMAWAFKFETFLSRKHTTAKRFGIEGAETLIPGMKIMIDEAADTGVDSFVIGMAHRGRLNMLGNVVRKPLAQIFGEFQGRQFGDSQHSDAFGSGDVKYHLGTSYDRPTAGRTGKKIHLSLMANPSHLEAVNTAVLGKVKAKQHFEGDTEKHKHIPLLIHGDGSMAGQGIVFETFDLSGLQNYSVGGCIHLVLNNQIAFTTEPRKSRSSPYCTDVAKTLGNCPIFHVNGDDVEAVSRIMKMAMQYRQEFKTDVVVDICCYRKFGHNELDEPSFTQPLMYQAIRKHKDAFTQYKEKLLAEGVVDQKKIDEIESNVDNILNTEYNNGKTYEPQKKDWLASHWSGFLSPKQLSKIRNTGVPMDSLIKIGEAITTIPSDFNAHKGIQKILENRRNMLSLEQGKEGMVDWGMAEHLAFGTLISEGFHVRISG